MRRAPGHGLGGATAIGTVLLAACGGVQADVDRALQRMREQPRADAYEASGAFPDGKVLQTPPAGTISRERILDPALATGRDSAGRYLQRIPMTVTSALLQRGRSRFEIYCAACHGAGGFGGSVVASNFTERRPPPLRNGPAAALSPGRVYEVVHAGLGRMPSYAGELSVADRWAVVAYVRWLNGRPVAGAGERDDSARAADLRRLDSLGPAKPR